MNIMAKTLLTSPRFKISKFLLYKESVGTCIHTRISSLDVFDPKGLSPCDAH